MLPGSQDENKYMRSPIFGDPALPFLAMIECAGYGIIDLYRLTCRYIGHGMQELCRNQSEQVSCGRNIVIAWVGNNVIIGQARV